MRCELELVSASLLRCLALLALGFLLVDTVEHLLGEPQAVDANWPAAVVGEVDHDFVDLVPADADVERAADVNLEFRVAAQHGQGSHGDH